jgi:hypothetical protein
MATRKSGAMEKAKRKPYEQRSDLEKIQSQWVKLTGLHDRTDWSAAVVRAATATEIAANFAIRREFAAQHELDASSIDKKLKKANGLRGKIDTLLLPLLEGGDKYDVVNSLHKITKKINDKRNGIVHRGEFCSKREATNLIKNCQTFVHGIVRLYEAGFTLKERSSAEE